MRNEAYLTLHFGNGKGDYIRFVVEDDVVTLDKPPAGWYGITPNARGSYADTILQGIVDNHPDWFTGAKKPQFRIKTPQELSASVLGIRWKS